MEPIITTTSEGYKVYIKPKITFGDTRAIEQAINARLSYDVETSKPNPITVDDINAGNRKAFELLILKVVMPDGTEAPDAQKVIYDFNEDDGKLLVDKIDEIYEASKSTKKNMNTTPTSEPEPSSPSTPTT